jgi:hypothetical protein
MAGFFAATFLAGRTDLRVAPWAFIAAFDFGLALDFGLDFGFAFDFDFFLFMAPRYLEGMGTRKMGRSTPGRSNYQEPTDDTPK